MRTDPRERPVAAGAEAVVVVREKGVAEAAGFPKPKLKPVEAAVEVVRLPNERPLVDAAAAEAGVLKLNPVVGFCANKLVPNPNVEVVLVVAGAGVEVCAPKPPNENPPVPAAGVLVAAPNENPPPPAAAGAPVVPRVVVPKLKLDILDLNLQNLTIRIKRVRPRGGPKHTAYDIRCKIKAAAAKFWTV